MKYDAFDMYIDNLILGDGSKENTSQSSGEGSYTSNKLVSGEEQTTPSDGKTPLGCYFYAAGVIFPFSVLTISAFLDGHKGVAFLFFIITVVTTGFCILALLPEKKDSTTEQSNVATKEH